jgi:inositol-1,3,4-trisphosphate 5/6-kinase/inositol-tetrakisphosphate 1-kinase
MSLTNKIDNIDGENFFIQKFHNHDDILYKVYFIGHHYHIVTRVSLKNIKNNIIEELKFDSQLMDKSLRHDASLSEEDLSAIENFGRLVREKQNLNFFGLDFIKSNELNGKLVVLDLNYFPGYEKFPNFNDCIIDVVRDKIKM